MSERKLLPFGEYHPIRQGVENFITKHPTRLLVAGTAVSAVADLILGLTNPGALNEVELFLPIFLGVMAGASKFSDLRA